MKKFKIKVNGTEYEVEVEELAQDGSIVQSTPATIVTGPAVVQTQSVPAVAAAPAPAVSAAPTPASAPAGARTIESPMPGVILDVNVSTGDSVKKGDVLLILEAMKMENEIVAPADGTVVSVSVAKGATVDAGDLLVSIN